MELIDRISEQRKAHRELYQELMEEPIDLDEIFNAMVASLRDNYIGYEAKRLYFTANEYRTYVLTNHRYNRLTLQMLARSLHQFAADMHDRRLRFTCDDWVDFQNVRADFRVRAYEDVLYVTSAEEGCPLVPGDQILSLQRMTPDQVRRFLRYNSFYSRDKERELWGGYLRMTDRVLVRHRDGSEEQIVLRHLPAKEEHYEVEFRMLGDSAYLRLETMDYDTVSGVIEEHLEQIAEADKLILDLRRNIGGDEEAAYGLLPYIVDRPFSLSELTGEEGHYTNFTRQNCEIRYQVLTQFRETLTDAEEIAFVDEQIRLYTDNYGKGIVFVPPVTSDERIIIPADKAPNKVIVLTDTFCENEGESFTALLKNAGTKVTIIGRPTMGTLDYFDTIRLTLNSHMTITYPISETIAAHEGKGIAEKGLPVDRYIPWTPKEIDCDVVLEAARNL